MMKEIERKMTKFTKDKLGKKFRFFETNEVCELVGLTKSTANLRPEDYDGLMCYSVVFDCPNEDDWEEITDEWNIREHWKLNDGSLNKNESVVNTLRVIELRTKLIADVNELFTISQEDEMKRKEVIKVLEKRFGWED